MQSKTVVVVSGPRRESERMQEVSKRGQTAGVSDVGKTQRGFCPKRGILI